jgi:hypothetical protein
VRRHFAETLGDPDVPAEHVAAVDTAVAWGRGQICVNGVWLPLRFKNWYRLGQDSFRFIEVSWYRRPLLTGRERFVGGTGTVELGGSRERGLTVDQSLNLLMWAEAVWFPAVLVSGLGSWSALSQPESDGEASGQPALADPAGVGELAAAGSVPVGGLPRWEPVDEHTARLVIPLRLGSQLREDQLLAHFDALSGRMTHFSAQRYRTRDGVQDKDPWRVDLLAWKHIGGHLLPVHLAVAWGESGSPGAYWMLEGVAYNVDIAERIP